MAAQSNPLTIYLSLLGSSVSKKTVVSRLKKVATMHGFDEPSTYPWHELDYPKTLEIIDDLKAQQLKYTTINAILSAIKGVANQAWLIGMMDGNEFAKIKAIKAIKGERLPTGQALSKPDICALFACTELDSDKAKRDQVILTLGFDLGLRREEISQLKIANVRLKEQVVRVVGKGNKEREVPLNARSTTILSDWIKHIHSLPVKGLFLLGRTNKKGELLDLNGIDNSSVWRVVKKVAMQSGVDFDNLPSTHDMRRTRVTEWLEVGNPRIAQQLAGHSHIQTTMGYDRAELADQMKDVQSKA
ncbi:tyrosine-type recombinase/integrase [Thiomicrospira microaerophila]|uniref:tyrosine-type recombinase/integrase n=1 Tax=Thiomicrospira microaerophila TaxID=406020 RepID=UPI00069666A0|nr:site-specific integrase [Thiomicrospira microaerophila]